MSLPSADIVTALQEQINRLLSALCNSLGFLQQHAPPLPLKQEALIATPRTYDVQTETQRMALDLVANLTELERLIRLLPDSAVSSDASETADVAQAVELMQANAQASVELQSALQAANAKLEVLQDAHAVLAQALLCQQAAVAQPAAPAEACDSGG